MKAMQFHRAAEPLVKTDVPAPELKPGEVLIDIKACGICGTDVHVAREGSIPTAFSPITLGHEPAGVIAAVGGGVGGWRVGDRVACYPAAFCGACPACKAGREGLCARPEIFGIIRNGAMAAQMSAPARCLVALPENIPFEVGAILTDAVSTPYHAVVRRARLEPGEAVAVVGCGGLGSQAIRFCKLFGALKVIAIDRNPSAIRLASDAGADAVIEAGDDAHKQVKKLTGGGVDVAFEFVGMNTTINTAIRSLRRGGRAVVVGIGNENIQLPPIRSFVGNEVELRGSMGLDFQDLKEVVALVAEGKLDLSGSTHAIPMDGVNDALAALAEGRSQHARYVVVP
ncbi:MAG: alcohol dehydrogenase catalytic domain-containing protein [Paracoccaceae bacterium]